MSERDSRSLPGDQSFSEKSFYLTEFRGRTLAIALPDVAADDLAPLEEVLRELAANGTRVVLLTSQRELLEKIVVSAPLSLADPRWLGKLWRGLREHKGMGLALPADPGFAPACREVSLKLRLAKLVWIDPRGALRRPDGSRVALVDLEDLGEKLEPMLGELDADQRVALGEIQQMLVGGVPAVNLCSLEGLHDELFTFAGSGTFFARKRYIEVRRLGLDDFDAAENLIRRGVGEGYLVARTPEALEIVLGSAFGVFVEGRYLAGIAALVDQPGQRSGEIVSLYTLTRFVGEGVGAHLIRYALRRAREAGLRRVFACTTSERVEAFFQRNGFQPASRDEMPPEKWRGYDPERLARVRCLRCDLDLFAER